MANGNSCGGKVGHEGGSRGFAPQLGYVALEPRILLDAAALATATDSLDDDAADSADFENSQVAEPRTATVEDSTSSDEVVEALAALVVPPERREVVIVDAAVSDYQSLVSGLDASVELVILSAERDGVAEIADYLEGRSDVDAVHLVSHGDVGQVQLGSTTLDAANADAYAGALGRIGASLNSSGDILLYGCRIGQDGAGQAFIDSLAELTGADVAASDDLTGSSTLGGDWILEASTGSIEAGNPIADDAISAWSYPVHCEPITPESPCRSVGVQRASHPWR